MMNGKTFDDLLASTEKHIKLLVTEDDDGKIDESEFHVICEKSKAVLDRQYPDHADHISISGFVNGDTLSFRVCYYNEQARAAYDRSVEFGVRALFSNIPEPTKKDIRDYIDKQVKKSLAK